MVLRSGWQGRQVMGTSDGLWGLVDGVNDAGLSISLTFGGRRVVGEGFGETNAALFGFMGAFLGGQQCVVAAAWNNEHQALEEVGMDEELVMKFMVSMGPILQIEYGNPLYG